MSVSDILDEIKEDVVPGDDLSLENITVIVKPKPDIKVTTSVINRTTVEKFNTLYNKLVKRQLVEKLDKLEVRVAHEVFTMLPDVSKTEYAKLTSAPSTINKNIVQKALSDVSDKTPEDAITMLKEFSLEIETSLAHVDEVANGLAAYAGLFYTRDKDLTQKPAIIIENRTDKNLYTEQIGDLAYVADTTLDYPKYSGVLAKKYEQLMKDDTLGVFLSFFSQEHKQHNNYGKSLENLVRAVLDVEAFFRFDALRNKLFAYHGELTRYLNSGEAPQIEPGYNIVNDAEQHVQSLAMVNMLHGILHVENNFLEKMKDLLEFID